MINIVKLFIFIPFFTFTQFNENELMKYIDTKIIIDSLANENKVNKKQLLHYYSSIENNILFSRKDYLNQAVVYLDEKEYKNAEKSLEQCLKYQPRLFNLSDSLQIRNSAFYKKFEPNGLLDRLMDSLISNTKEYSSYRSHSDTSIHVFYETLYQHDQFMRSNDVQIKSLISLKYWEIVESDLFKMQNKFDSINRIELQNFTNDLKNIDFYHLDESDKYTLFLVGQHSDFDLDFQKRILDIFFNNYHTGSIKLENLAYLIDRYLLNTKGYQLFGSQFEFFDKKIVSKNLLYPISKVNQMRKIASLPSLESYLIDADNLIDEKK